MSARDHTAVKDYFNRANPLAQHLGIRILELETGFARAEMTVTPQLLNPFGTANAGAIYALAETTFGVAANAEGQAALAVNLSITYLAPAAKGAVLLAEARALAPGNRLLNYAVTVRDEQGQLIAQAQAMGYRLKLPLPGLATPAD